MEMKVVQGGSGLDYRDVVAQIDLRDLLAPGKVRHGNKPVLVPCIIHSETTGSLAVYMDSAYCYGCGRRITTLEWIALQENLSIESQFSEVVSVAAEKYAHGVRVLPRTVEKHEVAAVALEPMVINLALKYHNQLGVKREWFRGRGLSDAVIDEMMLGHTGAAFSIPVFGGAGELLTIRYRRDDAIRQDGAKYWGTEGRNSVWLYNEKALTFASLKAADFVVAICEGELDTVRLWQEGIAAVSATNGARAFDEAFLPMFRLVKQVLVCFDQDDEGQKNAQRVAKMFRSKAKVVRWSREEGKDVTEFLKKHDVNEFRALICSAPRRGARHWGQVLRGGYWE